VILPGCAFSRRVEDDFEFFDSQQHFVSVTYVNEYKQRGL
jgi:hypothetical protein